MHIDSLSYNNKMKKLYTFLILLYAFTFAQAQNDLKARLEFEEAEKAFSEENYETALKHLNETEKELGRWTPNKCVVP